MDFTSPSALPGEVEHDIQELLGRGGDRAIAATYRRGSNRPTEARRAPPRHQKLLRRGDKVVAQTRTIADRLHQSNLSWTICIALRLIHFLRLVQQTLIPTTPQRCVL